MNTLIETRLERLTRLAAIGDDDQVDPALAQVRRHPEPRRVLLPDMHPPLPLEAALVAEVELLEFKLEAAREDLRRYRMSHGNDTRH